MTSNRWQDSANCIGAPIEWFYPPEGQPVGSAARGLCQRCTVQTECRRSSVDEDYGFWAQTTPTDRRRNKRGAIRDHFTAGVAARIVELVYVSDSSEQVFDVAEAAARLRVSESTVIDAIDGAVAGGLLTESPLSRRSRRVLRRPVPAAIG
jgi:IS30 family transposase